MCLFNQDGIKHTAKKPIICYKLVYVEEDTDSPNPLENVSFRSEIRLFRYKLGKEYRLTAAERGKSFDRKLDNMESDDLCGRGWVIKSGFHSYKRFKDAEYEAVLFKDRYMVVLRCEIPAGARYWVGNTGTEYAPCTDDPTRNNYAELCSEKIRVLAWKWGGKQHRWNKTTRAEWWPKDNLRKYVSKKKPKSPCASSQVQ